MGAKVTKAVCTSTFVFKASFHKSDKKNGKQKMFLSVRKAVLHDCNILLENVTCDSETPAVKVDHSKGRVPTDLRGIYIARGRQSILEGEDFRALDTVSFRLLQYSLIALQERRSAAL